MKKITKLVAGALLISSLTGCGEDQKAAQPTSTPQSTEQKQASDMKQIEKQIEEAKAKQPAKLDPKPMYRECRDKLEAHYKALEEAYASAKKNSAEWGRFSAKWNNDLNGIKETFRLNSPAQPNDVKFNLGVAAGEMFSLWQEYNAVIEGRRNDEQAIKTFKSSVKDNLAQAAEKLK